MASISSLMSSGSSGSIYGNKNIISGLATGMDTESLIQNAVKGYKLKLTQLYQQRTKVEWQQNALRSIIDKMVSFDQKYLSYASGSNTNLLSPSFFDSAVKIATQGANADKIVASGKLSSDVTVNSVSQVATSAKYSIGVGNLSPSNVATSEFDIKAETTVGTLSGSMTLGYGGKKVQISFNENDVFTSADEMAASINKKLEEETIAFDGGSQGKASEYIHAVVKQNYDGQDVISFETVKADDGNGVWIDSASGSIKETLGIEPDSEKKDVTGFTFEKDKLTEVKTMVDNLSKQDLTISYGNQIKSIKFPTKEELEAKNPNWDEADYLELLQQNIDKEFGQGKLKVSDVGAAHDGKIQLKFESTDPNTAFTVESSAGKTIGMEYSLTSYLNTSKKLKDSIPGFDWNKFAIKVNAADVKESDDGTYHVDKDGNRVAQDKDSGEWYRVDKDGNKVVEFKINDKVVGTFSEESSLNDVLTSINKNKDSDVSVSYSKFTGRFTFTAKESGKDGKIDFGSDGLAAAMFGSTSAEPGTSTNGQDAIFKVTVNGETKEVTQSSNQINIDGLDITIKETFTEDSGAVTFKSSSDTDKIVNVVKDMVKDFNEMATEIKKAYTTLPLQKSKDKYYEPLTGEQMDGMSESEIRAYEEKAKTGILFADNDLRSLYDGLRDSLSVLGVTDNDINKLGLTTSYKDGMTTLSLDEDKLRKALEEDPEKVKDIFTQSTNNGASSDGIMQSLKTQIDKYARTTGAVKGILIEKAGSTSAPTSVFQNTLQNKIKDIDKQISKWESKLSSQIDFYNHKFTKLEMLVSQMNGQSGLLMSLSGGGMGM